MQVKEQRKLLAEAELAAQAAMDLATAAAIAASTAARAVAATAPSSEAGPSSSAAVGTTGGGVGAEGSERDDGDSAGEEEGMDEAERLIHRQQMYYKGVHAVK
jgi:hypothetical protein